ncbi:hypothetical protein LguiA_031743 [Lonicera macranthoides]
MGKATLYVTAPAFASALGFYFIDSYISQTKELGGGSSMVNLVDEELKKGIKRSASTQFKMPKLAPQFDGLKC